MVHQRHARAGVQDPRRQGKSPFVRPWHRARVRAGTVRGDGGNRGRVGRGNFRLGFFEGVFCMGLYQK